MKEQRVITIFEGLNSLDEFNLDSKTQELNTAGWEITQIISTTFEKMQVKNHNYTDPAIAITLLCQREKLED